MTKKTPEEITAWHQTAKRVDDAATAALLSIPGADTSRAGWDPEWIYQAPCRMGVRLCWAADYQTGHVKYLILKGQLEPVRGSFAHDIAARELVNLHRELSLGLA